MRDRLRLVGNVQAGMSITAAADKLSMSQAWGSKWWARYEKEWFDGLKDRPRSGRPPAVDGDKIDEVIAQSSAWTSDSLLDDLKKDTGMRYCKGYGGILLRKWGYSLKVAVKQYVRRAPSEVIKKFQGNMRHRIRRYMKKGKIVLVQDEAIFVADAQPGRVYTPPGIRTVCRVSGTHDRTIVYGVLSLNGEQFFRQYDKFNGNTFAEFLKDVKKEFGKALMMNLYRRAEYSLLHRYTGVRLTVIRLQSPRHCPE